MKTKKAKTSQGFLADMRTLCQARARLQWVHSIHDGTKKLPKMKRWSMSEPTAKHDAFV